MKNKILVITLFILFLSIFINCKDSNIEHNTEPEAINYETLYSIINSINIDFSQFPANYVWEGSINDPILDTERKLNYRTIITNATREIPNFNGKYRIVEFGYGSGAQYFFIIDLNNGNVYEGIPSTHGIKYTHDSSLIIINDTAAILENWRDLDEDIPNWVKIEYVLWENDQFKNLLTVP